MSEFRLNELQGLLSWALASGQRFRLQFEPMGDQWEVVLIQNGLHCPTCQCTRTDPSNLPKDPNGKPRTCHWHHD